MLELAIGLPELKWLAEDEVNKIILILVEQTM
jgi:hypothetical protein